MRTFGTILGAALALAAVGCSGDTGGTGGTGSPGPRAPGSAEILITPVSHASFVVKAGGVTVCVDPVGKLEDYRAFPRPDLILITDIHRDHLAPELVGALRGQDTPVVGPEAVVKALGYGTALANGGKTSAAGLGIEAVPMYNLTAERAAFHPKGQGNGYVLTAAGKRVYVSGDTEDVPEMRALRGIDIALVCMNLPYTMTVEQAASAVREMKPRVVIPYHYRGKGGMSDLDKFEKLLGADSGIEVRRMDWYPQPAK